MSRNWCYTINNYTEEDKVKLRHIPTRYIIWGHEVGESGTPHLQGYLEFRERKSFKQMKEYHGTAHWEIRRGTQNEAIEYCKKDGNWLEDGEPAGIQGRRTDLCRIRENVLEEGMRWVTCFGNNQQINVAQKFLTYNEEPRNWITKVYWIYGETGTGKTRRARELFEEEDVYIKNNGSKWWDGYDGHECVIIDDFRDDWWPLTEMLSLLDRYEKRVEFKGGLRQFKPRKIVITSPYSPTECYKGTGEDIRQLTRRITEIEELRQ